MARRPAHLPDFSNPPLTEMVMGVMFDSLPINTSRLIQIWSSTFRNRYPDIEEGAALDSFVETFSKNPSLSQSFKLDFGEVPPIRFFLISNEQSELLQLQKDRFIRNWRERPNAPPYPRYEELRKRFEKDYLRFVKEAVDKDENPSIVQCEISYVNMLLSAVDGHDDLNKRLSELIRDAPSHVLIAGCELETTSMNMAWVHRDAGHPPARLRAQIAPTYSVEGKHAFRFTLTYRGAPLDSGLQSILSFMDRGRERIVTAFDEMTSEDMHAVWGKSS